MSNRGRTIPTVNRQVQENHTIIVGVEEDPETGEQVEVGSTPLRWLLDSLDKILFVETLTEAGAEITSDPEASCPVCFENYKKPLQEEVPESGQANQVNEKPLKLECGHIIGKNCLRGMIDLKCLGKRKCPLCRCKIRTSIRHIPLAHSDGQPDIAGALCCAIRLYLCTNPNKPETHEALNEWVHSPPPPPQRERTAEQQAYFAIMRNAVETWEEVGTERMRQWVKSRMRGELPDEGF